MNGQVPGWIQEDMKKHLPPPNGIQGEGSFVSPHDRPTTFQTSYKHVPSAATPVTPWVSQLDPRGVHPQHPAVTGMGVNPSTPWNYSPVVAADDNKKRRRVRKRPKKKASSYETYDSSSRSSVAPNNRVGSRGPKRSESISFGEANRTRGLDDDSFCRDEHHDQYEHHAYRGPNFTPELGVSSSDWGVVPPKEMKWNRRKGSYDLFPDWNNSSHHAKKYVQRRKGCC